MPALNELMIDERQRIQWLVIKSIQKENNVEYYFNLADEMNLPKRRFTVDTGLTSPASRN